VEVVGRGTVRIDQLQPGDLVFDGSASPSRFVAYVARNLTGTTSFVVMSAGKETLRSTPFHLIHIVDPITAQPRAVPAHTIRAGDKLLRAAGDGTLQAVMVDGVETVQGQGYINALTESGNIVVDGFLASCHTQSRTFEHESEWAKQAVFKPLVWLSKVAPELAARTDEASPHHWYVQATWGVRSVANAAVRLWISDGDEKPATSPFFVGAAVDGVSM